MVSIRRTAKRLALEAIATVSGEFRYFGYHVYFPPKSHLFRRACEEGIFEQETLRTIASFLRPGSAYFDVGANIGLLSIPILCQRPDVTVTSFEASPSTIPYLMRTHARAGPLAKWTVFDGAIGPENGEAEFWASVPERGAFDGLKDTGRGGAKKCVRVPVRTLDSVWIELGRPDVSVIKIDIEGGELGALLGAIRLIRACRPWLIIECSAENLKSYDISAGQILEFCNGEDLEMFSSPSFIPVQSRACLALQMTLTETFLIGPREMA